jgi:asparagine synthase (glutamine-hydrolysing)
MHCFSVAEDTTVATGDLDRARDLAHALGLPFRAPWYDHAVFAEEIDFSLEALEYFVWMMDAPRFAPESFFKHELHRYAKTRVPELKVILLGQGADEFAGGYSTSLSSPRPSWEAYVRGELVPHHRTLGPAPPVAPFHREMLARIWALQSHNLWNEDRVSSSQGVEARVPFLDHRLVELLAAIPEPLHARLFFDKAILREAARRLLPRRYTDAPKVLFWQAEDTSSVHRLMRDCLERSYPQFREAYGAGDLDPLYRAALCEDHGWTRASRTVLGRMTAMIFERLCHAAAAGDVPVRGLRPPSPLRELVPQDAASG